MRRCLSGTSCARPTWLLFVRWSFEQGFVAFVAARQEERLAGMFERLAECYRQDIAHELRTPLAVLRAELEALQDGIRPLEPTAVDSLHADVQRLGHLVDDLYELSIAEAHGGTISARPSPRGGLWIRLELP